MRQRRFMACIVEPKPVDDGPILHKAKNAWLWISRLRLRGNGPDFGKSKPKPQQRIRHFGILVKPGCHAERIGKVQTCQRNSKARIRFDRRRRQQPGFQRSDSQSVRLFGIKAEKCRAQQRFK